MPVEAPRKRQAAANEITIDAEGLHYRDLNELIHQAAAQGARVIDVRNVNGQRYIGAGLRLPVTIRLHGTAGNDLGVFMDGPTIELFGNAQDGAANTMNSGRIIIHGDAGQICGLSMRGGRVYVRGSVGYRSGIHMKGYQDKVPVVVIGGHAGSFLGEYMAGGRIYVLGLDAPAACPLGGGKEPVWRVPERCRSLTGRYTGTGMHGGAIYVRGQVDPALCGREAVISPATDDDLPVIRRDMEDYARCFGLDAGYILSVPFTRLAPKSHRPYGKNYAY